MITKAKRDILNKKYSRLKKANAASGFSVLEDFEFAIIGVKTDAQYETLKKEIEKSTIHALDAIDESSLLISNTL